MSNPYRLLLVSMFRIHPNASCHFGIFRGITIWAGRIVQELFIFFHVEENEPKEDAHVPLHPALATAVGARGNSPCL
jgi:hypothetical protein